MARLSTTACLTSAAGSAAAVSGQQDGTREEIAARVGLNIGAGV